MAKVEIYRGLRSHTFGYEYPVHVNGELYTVCRNLKEAQAVAAKLSA